jgi:hypothetical protein
MQSTQYGLPMMVSALRADVPARSLSRLKLEQSGQYNEAWLQQLIMRHPGLLPIAQVEPAFVPIIPVCMELPVPSGYIDNLYVTPHGNLVVGETKLFRNPESRREVVGQILDYAKDLASWDFEQLDQAVRKAVPITAEDRGKGLLEIMQAALGPDAVEEAQIIDAISRNLARGRFLLLVIGDGIQEGVEGLSRFLQAQAHLNFTFALVELAIFELPDPSDGEGYLVQPRVIARTVNVERGTYVIQNDRIAFTPPPPAAKPARQTTLSEEEFFEQLESAVPGATPRLKRFLETVAELNVFPEPGSGSLKLKWRVDEDRTWNLGSILTSGKVWTDILNYNADQVGLLPLSYRYLEQLAAAIPGAYIKRPPKPTSAYLAKDGTYVTITDLLDHEAVWLEAITGLIASVRRALPA